ncbi:unnamed protein product [Danaus chrysippus]|uniref:(African queen) hypothetical protein n=1 Tax=Danaus chrysippus TaxID=151541 RepID=A0A8J2R7H5_9NEOP|nr:unnamed protein product [Danaus chrysippus]
MENDPSKKESKGKRILKKALRRNSKSSNNSQNSPLDLSIGSRSKSFENKRASIEINDSTPLPTPDGTSEVAEYSKKIKIEEDVRPAKKTVDINETRNTVQDEPAASVDVDGSKKNLKRKFEEEGGAGTSGASTGASDTDADDKDPSKDKKKKNRCAVCRKKVGLTGFECRCGGLFCAVHRYSDKHECSFDYRELGAQEIRRNNPVVVSQKIHKI